MWKSWGTVLSLLTSCWCYRVDVFIFSYSSSLFWSRYVTTGRERSQREKWEELFADAGFLHPHRLGIISLSYFRSHPNWPSPLVSASESLLVAVKKI